jgi:hypothetical protein
MRESDGRDAEPLDLRIWVPIFVGKTNPLGTARDQSAQPSIVLQPTPQFLHFIASSSLSHRPLNTVLSLLITTREDLKMTTALELAVGSIVACIVAAALFLAFGFAALLAVFVLAAIAISVLIAIISALAPIVLPIVLVGVVVWAIIRYSKPAQVRQS